MKTAISDTNTATSDLKTDLKGVKTAISNTNTATSDLKTAVKQSGPLTLIHEKEKIKSVVSLNDEKGKTKTAFRIFSEFVAKKKSSKVHIGIVNLRHILRYMWGKKTTKNEKESFKKNIIDFWKIIALTEDEKKVYEELREESKNNQ